MNNGAKCSYCGQFEYVWINMKDKDENGVPKLLCNKCKAKIETEINNG